MQAQHLVLAPESLLAVQLLVVEEVHRKGRLLPRPGSISSYRAVTAAWRATEHAAVQLIRGSGLDLADYPELNPDHDMEPHRPWLAPALELAQAERDAIMADPEATGVLELICMDTLISAIRQVFDQQD